MGPYRLLQTGGSSLFTTGGIGRSNRYADYDSPYGDSQLPGMVLWRSGERVSGLRAWKGEFGDREWPGWVPFHASTRAALYERALELIEENKGEWGIHNPLRIEAPLHPKERVPGHGLRRGGMATDRQLHLLARLTGYKVQDLQPYLSLGEASKMLDLLMRRKVRGEKAKAVLAEAGFGLLKNPRSRKNAKRGARGSVVRFMEQGGEQERAISRGESTIHDLIERIEDMPKSPKSIRAFEKKKKKRKGKRRYVRNNPVEYLTADEYMKGLDAGLFEEGDPRIRILQKKKSQRRPKEAYWDGFEDAKSAWHKGHHTYAAMARWMLKNTKSGYLLKERSSYGDEYRRGAEEYFDARKEAEDRRTGYESSDYWERGLNNPFDRDGQPIYPKNRTPVRRSRRSRARPKFPPYDSVLYRRAEHHLFEPWHRGKKTPNHWTDELKGIPGGDDAASDLAYFLAGAGVVPHMDALSRWDGESLRHDVLIAERGRRPDVEEVAKKQFDAVQSAIDAFRKTGTEGPFAYEAGQHYASQRKLFKKNPSGKRGTGPRGGYSPSQRRSLPASDFLVPSRRAWPVSDKDHANIALQYMTRWKGLDAAKLIRKLAKDWPVDQNPELWKRYNRLKPKIEKQCGCKVPSLSELKGGRRNPRRNPGNPEAAEAMRLHHEEGLSLKEAWRRVKGGARKNGRTRALRRHHWYY